MTIVFKLSPSIPKYDTAVSIFFFVCLIYFNCFTQQHNVLYPERAEYAGDLHPQTQNQVIPNLQSGNGISSFLSFSADGLRMLFHLTS
jgi:hypothetical protein